MSYFKYLEKQLQRLELIKSESIIAAEREHFQSMAIISIEKDSRHHTNKENYDSEMLLIELKYPNTGLLPANHETVKKKKVEINYAITIYQDESLRIENEFKTKSTEAELILKQTLEKIEVEHNKNIINKKKLYESEIQKMDTEISRANGIYLSKEQEITRDYQNKSKKLHDGATKTHNAFGWQLSDLRSTSIFHESYRMLAKIIGLSGITEDVGTFVSKESIYNYVQPIITYLDLYMELKKQYKRKDLLNLVYDFYTPKPNSSFDLIQLLQSLNLDSTELSQEEIPYYKSPWYKCFSLSLNSNPEFRNHIHSVMAKYNTKLIQTQGWESMPLTKIHLGNAFQIDESPFNQTPWYAISDEYKKMQSVICSEYYIREKKLKSEQNKALMDAKEVLNSAIKNATDIMIENLEQDTCVLQVDTEKAQECSSTVTQTIKNPLTVINNPQILFNKSKKPGLRTIPEKVEFDENNLDDLEVCKILDLSSR